MILEVIKQVSIQRLIEKHMRHEKIDYDELTHFVDYREMRVCGLCGEIFGKFRYEPEIRIIYYDQSLGPLEQVCECKGRKTQEVWPRFDFNEIITLCYSCGQDLMMSGSKGAIWFCHECLIRINNYNAQYSQYYIPIGRHSIMHGYKVVATAG
jgi:hypothetical protein